MNILALILAIIALILAWWCGKVFYRSSAFWGIVGVLIGSFFAAWFGLQAFDTSLWSVFDQTNLWRGFIVSGIIAFLSLLMGCCGCGHKTCATKKRSDTSNGTYAATTATPTKVKKTAATTITRDDLKKIEGIGPVVEQHLNKHGFYTFQDLANATVDTIQNSLAQDGKRFGMMKCDTRPEQAQLCADGAWDALTSLQDKLKAGRKA